MVPPRDRDCAVRRDSVRDRRVSIGCAIDGTGRTLFSICLFMATLKHGQTRGQLFGSTLTVPESIVGQGVDCCCCGNCRKKEPHNAMGHNVQVA